MKEQIFNFKAIGYIRSPYREKFGIPRQPNLATTATSVIELADLPHAHDAIKGLEEFSHLWVIFVFNGADPSTTFRPTVRPPRLGGAQRVGVLASRFPHRPNPLGISAVRILKIEADSIPVKIHVQGGDFLDKTPVLDIKPYLPYADQIADAKSGWADEPIARLTVLWSDAARKCLQESPEHEAGEIQKMIEEAVALDPRPAHQSKDSGPYAMHFLDYDVHWEVQGDQATVFELRIKVQK